MYSVQYSCCCLSVTRSFPRPRLLHANCRPVARCLIYLPYLTSLYLITLSLPCRSLARCSSHSSLFLLVLDLPPYAIYPGFCLTRRSTSFPLFPTFRSSFHFDFDTLSIRSLLHIIPTARIIHLIPTTNLFDCRSPSFVGRKKPPPPRIA